MSSGSHVSPGLGFNNTGKPATDRPPCPTARYEDDTLGALFAGLCHRCGRATRLLGADGRPCHDQVPALAWTWAMILAEHAARPRQRAA